jgi:cyclic-di-AMP phosphodiesterase PgpH
VTHPSSSSPPLGSQPNLPSQPGLTSSQPDGGDGPRRKRSGAGKGPGGASLTRAIPRRPRVGVLAGLILALGFGLLITPTIAIDTWLVQLDKLEVSPTARAAATVRVPLFAGHRDGAIRVDGGGVLIARGEVFGRDRAAATAEIYAATPRGGAPYVAYFLLCAALVAVYAHHMRRTNRGRLLRVQIVHLLTLVVVAVLAKIALLTTSVSVLALPVAVAAIVPTLVFDRIVGLATGVLCAVVISLLVPFDVGVIAVLVAQAATAGLLVPESPKRPLRASLLAGLASAGVAAFIYGVFTYLTKGALPVDELRHPAASAWVAATVGGALSAVLSMLVLPVYQLLVGELTSAKLTQLQDLSQPLLRQIAEKSPGTWQHSLAMANMAEIAANEIGASGRLVRVGAYYHDLGKSLQAKYFIENIEPGETSPHEHLPPEVSCDAIFAHVTEGIVAARRAKLHERVIDFMHMHHGNGVLEYFWAKCQRQGNPKQLGVESFRYPGVPPQSRETAILAICDAVEAASRTLKKPDSASIGSLVQRIVYGKLHLGQLDESGLSMSDLRKISDSLRETIRHAHHGRIEYPWQEQQAQGDRAEAGASTGGSTGAATGGSTGAATGTGELPGDRSGERPLSQEPRLDSLDAPRPPWHSKPQTADGRARSEVDALAIATTAMGRTTLAPAVAAPVPAVSAPQPMHSAPQPMHSAPQPMHSAPPGRTSGLEDLAISSRVTRRGLGPPPAPAGRTTSPLPLLSAEAAYDAQFSDPAITTPRMTAQSSASSPSLSQSSLARRIDASLSSMSDDDDELADSPFTSREDALAATNEPSQPILTSARRTQRNIDRFSDRDEPRDRFGESARRTPSEFAAETAPAMPSYPGDADVTSQQPLAELEQLAAMSGPSNPRIRRPSHQTHEVDPDDIEAAIEVAPPARRTTSSVVQRLPGPPKPRK